MDADERSNYLFAGDMGGPETAPALVQTHRGVGGAFRFGDWLVSALGCLPGFGQRQAVDEDPEGDITGGIDPNAPFGVPDISQMNKVTDVQYTAGNAVPTGTINGRTWALWGSRKTLNTPLGGS
jgi:hypothetical protein